MYTQARRTYPIYAAVILLTIMLFGAFVCVTAKSPTAKTTTELHGVSAVLPAKREAATAEIKRIESPKEAHIPQHEATVMVTEPETPEYLLDVPLTDELQTYIYELCEERKIPYTLVIAMIEQESSYRSDVISKTNDYGLMQINTINHDTIGKTLGITDFLDPEQNCNAGIYMIADYYQKYKDTHKALMAYNLGETGARRRWDKGVYTTAYSESVIEIMERLEEQSK